MKNKKENKFDKLTIAVSSSALFDLTESDKIFKNKGEIEYRKFQNKNLKKILKPGIAFLFIRKILYLNEIFKNEIPEGVVEVVLLSKNDHETGLRVFKSAEYYNLNISKAGFFSGESPSKYIKPFNASLFLSGDFNDVELTLKEGYAAGYVMGDKPDPKYWDESDNEFRIAFDFDGVLVDRESEDVFNKKGIKKYKEYERNKSTKPHNPGPLSDFAKKISRLRELESDKIRKNKKYKRFIKIALITARSTPVHERVLNSIKNWGLSIDKSFFMGGFNKKEILETMKPHIYFDDQEKNLENVQKVPLVFIPLIEN